LEDIVASTELFYRDPSGSEGTVAISIGRPVEAAPGAEFRCPVSISLDPAGQFAAGADSFQSLCLALVWVRMTLERYEERGWRFFAEPGDG
jgi:hypothetical protein